MARKNSSKINKEQEVVDQVKTELVEEPKVIDEPKEQNGEVYGCDSLNVRENPLADAKILGIINKSTIVKILDSSNSNYYQIEVNGLKGYCMKKYIKIKE